jgi:hypothetical protein
LSIDFLKVKEGVPAPNSQRIFDKNLVQSERNVGKLPEDIEVQTARLHRDRELFIHDRQ